MEKYHRLTLPERYQISALKNSGLSIREIAAVLERSASSISRELKRNTNSKYFPSRANELAMSRRENVGPKPRINNRLKLRINEYLQIQWSPKQISEAFKSRRVRISPETIYDYIYEDQRSGGKLYLNLRRRRKWRRSRAVSRNFKNVGKRVNQTWIDDRPKLVEDRKRVGDFERDTVLGKKGSPILLTIVDRTSRLTKIVKMKSLNAELAHRATIKALEGFKVHTITNDNGPEFSLHKKTAKALNTKIYFTHPYCSWQRGTNENTNGLIRQYYPKGYDFRSVTDLEIKRIEDLLNNRPRKCLGFKTPLQVHRLLSRVLH